VKRAHPLLAYGIHALEFDLSRCDRLVVHVLDEFVRRAPGGCTRFADNNMQANSER